MKKWEYKVTATGYLGQFDLLKFGNEGWELCGVEPGTREHRCIFKKEITTNEDLFRAKYPSVKLAYDQYLMLLKLAEAGEIKE